MTTKHDREERTKKELDDMRIMEVRKFNPYSNQSGIFPNPVYVMRVPGGWFFDEIFVPYSNEVQDPLKGVNYQPHPRDK